MFPVNNGLKIRNVFPLSFQHYFENAIRKVHANQVGLKWNVAKYLLAYVYYNNIAHYKSQSSVLTNKVIGMNMLIKYEHFHVSSSESRAKCKYSVW